MSGSRVRRPLLSLVIPCLNEAENIPLLYQAIRAALARRYRIECIFVDDGSSDQTVHVLQRLSAKHRAVRWIRFTRNFGHQAALKAGMDLANGAAVITMDADLEHPPSLLTRMVARWEEGYKIVYTLRREYADASVFKRMTSRWFYKIFRLLSGVELEIGAADFRLLDREVVLALRSMPESVLFLRGTIAWLGYRRFALSYTQGRRTHGTSHYTTLKMLQLALVGITAFSVRPLYLSAVVGMLLSIVTGLYGVYAVVMYLFFGTLVLPGWASIIASVLFIGGVQLVMLGIIGIYIGSIFLETKRRPHYIIESSHL